jgi:hypothetical protein
LLLAGALLGGCDQSALAPQGAVAMSPPAVYEQWWQRVVSCAGVSRTSYSAIRWYVVPGVTSFADPARQGHRDHGLWVDAMPPRIYLAEGVSQQDRHVRHEMMHAALRRTTHDPDYFGPRCDL